METKLNHREVMDGLAELLKSQQAITTGMTVFLADLMAKEFARPTPIEAFDLAAALDRRNLIHSMIKEMQRLMLENNPQPLRG